jgi:myo-inositol-1(or 4)-monophosphatase
MAGMDHDWNELADLAERVALGAAAMLRDGLTRDQVEIETKSTGTDMVSEMDKAAEQLIVDELLAARPDDGILGEEGSDRAGRSGIRWVIDPLDGTTNYLYRHPGFSVSIAAEPDGARRVDPAAGRSAVAGVVVDIVSGDRFRAVRGGGATRNGRPVAASPETDLARALVATGFGYDAHRRRDQVAILGRIIGDIRDIRRMGSAALDLCSVACGRVDAYYEAGLAPWDLAAGALIAAEAGAVVSYLPATVRAATTVVAAPPALSTRLRELLLAAGEVED